MNDPFNPEPDPLPADPADIVMMFALLAVLFGVLFALAGCSAGHTGASATSPSTYEYKSEKVEEKQDGTKTTTTETITHTGPGNEKKSGAYEWSREWSTDEQGRMVFKHGASSAVPFDWELAVGTVDAWPATIAGGILIVGGAIGVYLSQRTIGIILIAAGGCAIALPFVAETLRFLFLIAGIILIAAAVLYGAYVVLWQGKKLNLVKKVTGKDAQEKLKAKGDKAGAAAAAYVAKVVESGKEEDAKAAAKAVNP